MREKEKWRGREKKGGEQKQLKEKSWREGKEDHDERGRKRKREVEGIERGRGRWKKRGRGGEEGKCRERDSEKGDSIVSGIFPLSISLTTPPPPFFYLPFLISLLSSACQLHIPFHFLCLLSFHFLSERLPLFSFSS